MSLFSRFAPHEVILGILVFAGLTAELRAEDNPAPGPTVVELYTSQGCSSCPPADAVLGELSAMPNVIALGFHVDYWNNDGWRDRFTLANATDRQRKYVQTLKISSGAFTPQVVVDGRTSFVGSDKPRILSALAEARSAPIPVSVAVTDGTLLVSLPETQDKQAFIVYVAAYLPQATTPVGRGENSGKTLQEFNIVRQFRYIGTWKGHAEVFRALVSSFPADASRAAILVQRDGQGTIAGSAVIALR